jgi:hypothetical protein
VAAIHGNDPNSPTFQTVRAAFAHGPIDFVIVEGFPEKMGTSPGRMVEFARRVAGAREDGEPFLAIRLATDLGAGFTGGEPTDSDVLRGVTPKGMSASDLFGFYVLRQIEQWEREGRISGPRDPMLDEQIKRFSVNFASNTGVPPEELSAVATLDGWKAWYRSVNGIEFERGYRHEDAYPSTVGSRATNAMDDKVTDVRDQYIVGVIAGALDAHDNVLVVYGGSHNVVQAPALEAAFGRPSTIKVTILPQASAR